MLEPHPQRGLVPQSVFVLFRPVLAHLLQLDVEVPKHACEDRAHLKIRQPGGNEYHQHPFGPFFFDMTGRHLPFPYTSSGAHRERLQCGRIVVAVFLGRRRKEALGVKGVRTGEIGAVTVRGPLVHTHG